MHTQTGQTEGVLSTGIQATICDNRISRQLFAVAMHRAGNTEHDRWSVSEALETDSNIQMIVQEWVRQVGIQPGRYRE